MDHISTSKNTIWNYGILFLVLAVAIILRGYNYFNIPFTFDEFSALSRLQFNSFSELIEKGVKVDGHPAGIQVFLYYWTKFVGNEEWKVKLPFTIFGVIAVFYSYLIGKKWFNETVGLLVASMLASLQFTIMFSQIARPYISGLLFTLMMVYYWTKLIFNPQKSFYFNAFLFILSSSLNAYNHHFSLLMTALVGISGWILVEKKYRRKYLFSLLIIFILYTPHLGIFFHQLKRGGIEVWLAKPENDFLLVFIHYLLHFSIINCIVLAILLILAYYKFKSKVVSWKFILLALLWFVLPFMIGFYYSRYINAVLKFPVLIFSFPFLFYALFGPVKIKKPFFNLIFVVIILSTNILTLIFSRDYYSLFYQSVFEEFILDYQKTKKSNEKTLFIVDSDHDISEYFAKKHQINIQDDVIWYNDSFKDISTFKDFLQEQNKNYDRLFFACLSQIPPLTIPAIRIYFPKTKSQKHYVGGSSYIFNKEKNLTNKYIGKINFDEPYDHYWTKVDSLKIVSPIDQHHNYCYAINGEQWSLSFIIPLQEAIENENNFIDISLKIQGVKEADNIFLASALQCGEEKIHWSATKFSDTDYQIPKSDWKLVQHSIKLSDIHLNHKNILLNIHIWNRGGENFLIDDFEILLREGNPIIYGLNEKLY